MKILGRMLSSLLFILVTAWLLLTLLIYAFQPRFVYFPGKSLSHTPADIGLSYRDIFFHSRDDELIPYEFGQRLYAAAGQPKYFLEISGGHNDGFYSSGRQYSNGLSDFLNAGLH